MELVRNDTRPSQIVTREALENAAASVAATGGSTNGVLHLLAIARELGIPFELEDFDRIAARDSGRREPQAAEAASSRPTSTRPEASPSSHASSCKGGLVQAQAPNVDGRTLGQIAADSRRATGARRWSCRSRRR